MTVPWLNRPPSEIVFDHILLTTQPIEEPNNRQHLHQILDMFPAGKMLMFSTDFPHWDGDNTRLFNADATRSFAVCGDVGDSIKAL